LFSSGRKFFEHLSFLHNITIIAPIYLVRENSLNTWRAWRQQGLKLNTPSMDLVGKQQPAQTIVGVHGERGEMKSGRSVLTLMGRLEGGVNGLELMRGEARKQCCSRGLEPRWRVIGDEPPPPPPVGRPSTPCRCASGCTCTASATSPAPSQLQHEAVAFGAGAALPPDDDSVAPPPLAALSCAAP
jgi:hypothetical protein